MPAIRNVRRVASFYTAIRELRAVQGVRPAAGNARKSGGENHPDTVVSKQLFWLNGAHIVKDGTIIDLPAFARI